MKEEVATKQQQPTQRDSGTRLVYPITKSNATLAPGLAISNVGCDKREQQQARSNRSKTRTREDQQGGTRVGWSNKARGGTANSLETKTPWRYSTTLCVYARAKLQLYGKRGSRMALGVPPRSDQGGTRPSCGAESLGAVLTGVGSGGSGSQEGLSTFLRMLQSLAQRRFAGQRGDSSGQALSGGTVLSLLSVCPVARTCQNLVDGYGRDQDQDPDPQWRRALR